MALVHGTPLQAAERLGLRSRGSGWGERGGGTPYGPSEQRRGLKVRSVGVEAASHFRPNVTPLRSW